MRYDAEKEKRLNNLITQTRINLRLGRYDEAAKIYTNFNEEYGLSSTRIKEKFIDAASNLRKEIKNKLT